MPQARERIALTIENAGAVERTAWPITQGVPFAEGQLERGQPVRVVDGDGQPLPTQSACLATWQRDRKHVKWLLVDFQCDLGVDEKREVFVEYGEGADPPPPAQPVEVSTEGGRLRLDTGALELELRTDSADFLAGCLVGTGQGRHDVFRRQPGPHLYLTDTSGNTYDSWGAAPAPRVTVEDSGPLRASVCVRGYHASADGVLLCPYTVRMHVFAGRRDVRLFHTFVFDQNPDVLEFAQVGLRLPLDLGDGVRMAFGGQRQAHGAQTWERAGILQSSDLAYEVTRDGEVFGAGEKTSGWASLSGSRATVCAVVGNWWQQYPKGFEVTASGLDIQLWPASCGEPLVYSTPWKERACRFDGYYGGPVARAKSRDEETVRQILEDHPTAPINLKSFGVENVEDVRWVEEVIDRHAPDRLASHNDTGTSDGTGAAKTHEIWLRFDAESIADEEAESLAVRVQEPVIAPPDPAYLGATRAARDVLGGVHPAFAQLDELLSGATERVAIEPMHRGRQWGFWRFGNMCCSHTAGAGLAYILHYDTDPVKGLRHVGPYNNEADDPCWGLWTQFLRTGRRDFFLAACGHSQAMGDVGICHAHPTRPELVGLMHYHNAHQWTGGHSPSHTLNTTHFLHYYLTGDRRLRDIALEVADWAVNTQEPAGIISCRSARLNREFTGPLVCATEAYVATWMPKYGDLARRSLNWLLRTQEEVGTIGISVVTRGEMGDEAVIEPTDQPLSHGGIMYPIYYEGLRHFDGELLRETILAEANHVIRRCGGGHVVTACALAYEITGDPVYAAMCKRAALAYTETAAATVEMRNPSMFSGLRNGYVAVLKAAAARAMEQPGFAEAEKRLEQAIDPPPPAPAPEIVEKSLGVPEGYS